MTDDRARWVRATLILMGLGATLGSALDAIHSHFGALSYTTPVFARAAWWVPLLFSGAYGSAILRPLLTPRAPPPSGGKVALGLGLFIAAYWLTVAPWSGTARAVGLTALFGVAWAVCDPTGPGLLAAAVGAVGGPTVEILLVRAGTFVHHEVLGLGIPGWLPLLYLTAAVGLGGLARWLVARPAPG